jgi:hypothetical protein
VSGWRARLFKSVLQDFGCSLGSNLTFSVLQSPAVRIHISDHDVGVDRAAIGICTGLSMENYDVGALVEGVQCEAKFVGGIDDGFMARA